MLRINKEQSLVEVKRSISNLVEKRIDTWSVWNTFEMKEAIRADFAELITDYPISEIKIIDTDNLPNELADELIFVHKDQNLNFAVKLKISPVSYSIYNMQNVMSLGSIALIIVLLIISFLTYRYLKIEVFVPLHQLIENMNPKSNSARLSSNIKSQGEMKKFIDKISDIYDLAKLNHREKVIIETVETIAHDLRKPYSISQILCNHLLRKGIKDPLLESGIRTLKDTLERTDSMALELLDPQHSCEDSCVLPIVVKKVLNQYEETSDFRINEDIAHAEVSIPEHRLVRIIENIIENAIQATNGKTEITIKSKTQGPIVELMIANTRSFISAEKINFLFERGYTSGSANSLRHGLGLSIVKKIIDEAKGSISCNSDAEKGTRFNISLTLKS